MPAKSSPSRAAASRSWRSGAMRKTAAFGVTAPHRVRFAPRSFQPVSSTLSAGAARMRASRSS